MTVDVLEGEEFTDRYTEAIAQIIEAKREEQPLPTVPEPEQQPRSSKPARKTAAKKTAARKSTGRHSRSA
ncbi:hypothetical protein AB5J72_51450 (plasmid) [Streptomyces sp. CG1]|uniref:hypothetical protein n=1 Tax=Streptomyces sp. CG1 TaxID=1287523 RepID=UPI0034E264DA